MSLIGNIDNIPLFTTIAEAELWGSQYGISGYHTHTLLGQLGYMAGFSHADILAANLNLVSNLNIQVLKSPNIKSNVIMNLPLGSKVKLNAPLGDPLSINTL